MKELTCFEICAGAGGQSLGLERAGFEHVAAVEIEREACETLRLNRPSWHVMEWDIHSVDAKKFVGVDLFAGGVPCPPFSIAGKRLGEDDERDLFPRALDMIAEAQPRAVMLENVKGLATARFAAYRAQILERMSMMDYVCDWQVLNASDFGVPQLRPRFILVGLKAEVFEYFEWPTSVTAPPTVGKVLKRLMAADGWLGAPMWAKKANVIGPTLVGGSRKHGGPDLGPTRARAEWLRLGVDGKGLADAPPTIRHPLDHIPRLTLPMAAAVQGFPPGWRFAGRKTAAYRQIGNAFPPPVAEAVGSSIKAALDAATSSVSGKKAERPLLRAV
ncbi:MAG: DNA cytosine methyltransferase [Pseudonocardiales bacterium]